MKFLIVARSNADADAFAQLNELDDYLVGESVQSIDGIANLTAVFVDGWRERADAFAMVQAVNMAEIHGVQVVEALADDLFLLWEDSPEPLKVQVWRSVSGES